MIDWGNHYDCYLKKENNIKCENCCKLDEVFFSKYPKIIDIPQELLNYIVYSSVITDGSGIQCHNLHKIIKNYWNEFSEDLFYYGIGIRYTTKKFKPRKNYLYNFSKKEQGEYSGGLFSGQKHNNLTEEEIIGIDMVKFIERYCKKTKNNFIQVTETYLQQIKHMAFKEGLVIGNLKFLFDF